MNPFKPRDEYKAACELVLSAPNRDAAFDDYAATIKAFRANGYCRIDGVKRDDLEWRQEMRVCEFEDDSAFFAYAIYCASHHGINIDQLADLFDCVPPDSGRQALCIVEDAVCILETIEESA